ncbi:MAG: cation:proton antiporter, partial [bacterium]
MSIFISISIILAIAIAVAYVIQLLKQPLIISYIITGIICGPLFLDLINSQQEFFNVFAEFGVILLLFLVGLSLNINILKKIGRVAVIAGTGQVIFTSIFGFLLLTFLGFSNSVAAFLAISVTFSSTIIIVKLLSDKRELRTIHGRYTLGLMLVQDVIAVMIMILLPILQNTSDFLLAFAEFGVRVVLVVLVVYALSKIFLPVILKKVAGSGEFLFIFTIAWCFSLAGLGEWFGLSLEVGAVAAGISLGSSVYRTEISSRIKPLRDFFIILFFIILGSGMRVENISDAMIPSVLLSLFVLIGNPVILYILYRTMKFNRRSSFLAGITAAQVSEFGFVLLFVCQKMGYVGNDAITIFTIVALITIFISSYLITYNSQIYKFVRPFFLRFGKDKYSCPEEGCEEYETIIFGYHRIGWKICEALKEMKISFAVVDIDPAAIEKLEARKIPCFFGDVQDVEFLNELPISRTKMIISTIPEVDGQITLIKHIKAITKKPLVIATLSHSEFLGEVYEAGADYVIMPHLLGGQFIADILKGKPWNKKTFQ